MNVVSGLAFLLVNVRLSLSCYGEGPVLFCQDIPSAFSPGYSSMLMSLKDVGEINSTVLRSDSLASVTRLRIVNSGVTGIAEGAFGSFQNLMEVSLNQNLLTVINPNWFGQPETLNELNVTENKIKVLNESTFNGLSMLTKLRLRKNMIIAIDPNTFSSQTILAELDLSGNKMTRLSPEVFRSLKSTWIRLDGNPWDCSCGAEDFVDFLKDLQNRSLLGTPMEVTCESPPTLKGRPVWNVSVCLTSPPPGSPDVLTTVPAATAKPPAQPTSETSVQPRPPDDLTTVPAASAQPTSATSVQPRPPDVLTTATTPTLKTATSSFVTSPPSMTDISLHPKPSVLPIITISTPTGMTETCGTSQPSSDTNIVSTLVVVIAVLSLLLFVLCFLVVLHRRKRINKTVMPGGPRENRNEPKEDGGRSICAPELSEKRENPENERWDSEMGRRRTFTGVRAKSANAILFMSPFCAPVRVQVTSQTETEAQEREGKQKQGDESEVDGGIETENQTNIPDINAIQARNLDKDPHCVPVNTDTVPYLSIGTNQNKPRSEDFNKQSTDGPGPRSHAGKVMGRISTWPPTAIQWQARCKMIEEGSDVFTVWTPKCPGEVRKVEHPSGSDRDNKEDETETEDPLKTNVAHVKLGHSQSSKPSDKTILFSEAHTEKQIQDPATVRQTTRETQNLNQAKRFPNQDPKPADKSTSKSSNKAEQRGEPKRAVTSRQRAENRSSGSRAPSGGASPDDETLLSGNEYAFMDLLHEVAQNNGRWTRERWKQNHVNKQRHQDRGTDGV